MSDALCILRRDDAFFREHRRVGLASGNVLPVQVAVKINRGVDLLHDRIGPGPKASAPHFVAHDAFAAEVLPPMTEPSAEPYYKVRRRRVIAIAGLVRNRGRGRAGGGIRDGAPARQSGRCCL